MEIHKDSSRVWVKNKQPMVETYLGWIEKYVDPQNMRAMWSGWVAFNDRERTKKFIALVDRSDKVIPKLPFEKDLQKEKFNAPDFASLDVMTFAGDRLPSGINIPNYYDVRENDGFKNVMFETKTVDKKITKKSKHELGNFKNRDEEVQFINNERQAYQVQVAGHELFGHGSGRMVYRDPVTGKCPLSLEDPMNPGQFINSCYEKKETYNQKFGHFSTSFEECRADLSGLYLEAYPEMYEIFNWTQTNATTLQKLSMMTEFRKGILGLKSSYNKETKRWTQAHT